VSRIRCSFQLNRRLSIPILFGEFKQCAYSYRRPGYGVRKAVVIAQADQKQICKPEKPERVTEGARWRLAAVGTAAAARCPSRAGQCGLVGLAGHGPGPGPQPHAGSGDAAVTHPCRCLQTSRSPAWGTCTHSRPPGPPWEALEGSACGGHRATTQPSPTAQKQGARERGAGAAPRAPGGKHPVSRHSPGWCCVLRRHVPEGLSPDVGIGAQNSPHSPICLGENLKRFRNFSRKPGCSCLTSKLYIVPLLSQKSVIAKCTRVSWLFLLSCTHRIQNSSCCPVLKYFAIIRMAPAIWQLRAETNSSFGSEQKF